MESEKAKSKSVSFLPSMWVKIEAEAQSTHGSNRSTYLRKLVEADLSEKSDSDHKAAAIDYESSIEKPILQLIRSRCAGIEHLYHKAYKANGGPPEEFDERLILSRLLEQALGLIAKHYEADFRVVTDIDLARLLEEAKDDDTFQERARRATDYVRRPESIAAAADHGIVTQADRQQQQRGLIAAPKTPPKGETPSQKRHNPP